MQKIYPKVGIVIVNYNGFRITAECIDSVFKIDYPNYKIILIDNGSTDNSGIQLKKKYNKKIIFIRKHVNKGVTGGNNSGIETGLKRKMDYILFLNNDTIAEKIFLNKLVKASLENNHAIVVPKIICYYKPERLDHWVSSGYNWYKGLPKSYKPYPKDNPGLNISSDISVASTCCLLAPVAIFEKIGLMDENYFMYYDDADFTIRAVRAGWPMRYESSAVIYHKCNVTTKNKQPAYFEYYLQNRNVFYFYYKLCKNPLAKVILLGKHVIIIILQLFKALLLKDRKRIRVIKLLVRDIMNKKMGMVPDFNDKP